MKNDSAKLVIEELNKIKNPAKAKILAGFFKTGKGQYGEGDVFLGITVPEQRAVAKKHLDARLNDLLKLLKSRIHEHRLVALLVLVDKYKKACEDEKKEIAGFYLKHARYVNNWDLVDLSAPGIAGPYFFDKDKTVLYSFARSKNLWERRIAVLSTFCFIRNKEYKDALRIYELLLKDEQDLIHKAVGWMLRELGKRNLAVEESFLKKHRKTMPRTMLRYAIEKFSQDKRDFYMYGS